MSWKESPLWRSIRRFGIMFIIGGIGSLLTYFSNLPPEQQAGVIPIIVAVLAFADKAIRENWK